MDVAAQGHVGQLAGADVVAGGQVLGGGQPDWRQKGAGHQFVHLAAHRLQRLAHAVEVALDVGHGLHQVGDAAHALGEQAVEVLVGEVQGDLLLHAGGQGLQQRGEVVEQQVGVGRQRPGAAPVDAVFLPHGGDDGRQGAGQRRGGLGGLGLAGVVDAPAFLVQVVDQAGDLGAVALQDLPQAGAVEEQGQPVAVGDDARQVLAGHRRGAEPLFGGGELVGDEDAGEGRQVEPGVPGLDARQQGLDDLGEGVGVGAGHGAVEFDLHGRRAGKTGGEKTKGPAPGRASRAGRFTLPRGAGTDPPRARLW